MKIKKLLAVLVTGTMILSFAGCSSSSKVYESAFDDLGYEVMEEYDEDDVEDLLEDGLYYSTKDEKELKKICKDSYLDGIKAKDVSSVMVATRVDNDDMFVFYSVTFKDKDTAADTFEDLLDALDEQEDMFKDYLGKINVKSDSDDDFYTVAINNYGSFNYYDVFMDDAKTMTIIVGVMNNDDDVFDDYKDFYEAIERDLPVELLKEEPGDSRGPVETAAAPAVNEY